nr:hypothetical protein [Deinococcus yavapaiensis]
MAYRLRSAVGGRVAPRGPLLPLSLYARKRIERQSLAGALVRKEIPLAGLREIDRLTNETAFGFWHNPAEVADFLRAALRGGGHPALGDPNAFESLLSDAEKSRLGVKVNDVCRHYLTCLALAAPGIDPSALESIYKRVEAFDMPLFADELPDTAK